MFSDGAAGFVRATTGTTVVWICDTYAQPRYVRYCFRTIKSYKIYKMIVDPMNFIAFVVINRSGMSARSLGTNPSLPMGSFGRETTITDSGINRQSSMGPRGVNIVTFQ